MIIASMCYICLQKISEMHQIHPLIISASGKGSLVISDMQTFALKSVAKYLQSSFAKYEHPSPGQIDHNNVDEDSIVEHCQASILTSHPTS